ncbi:conserved protein, unknown function [Hepatocystis sp. ex Piliocolobus tephrosceles]|nr:conserved protein, unknown function [Hepatocystis sp. ex Piliocolobus tephrosceles]
MDYITDVNIPEEVVEGNEYHGYDKDYIDDPEDNEVDTQAEIFVPNQIGRMISEKYLNEFINKDIFFIGEVINQTENLLVLKSVNGNCVDCILREPNSQLTSKVVGIKGTVTNDLKILESRGVIILEDVNFDIINDYIDIYMENANSEVFLPPCE